MIYSSGNIHLVDAHICVTETYVMTDEIQLALPAYINVSSDGKKATIIIIISSSITLQVCEQMCKHCSASLLLFVYYFEGEERGARANNQILHFTSLSPTPLICVD